jgi:hypothetical protein
VEAQYDSSVYGEINKNILKQLLSAIVNSACEE